MASLTTRPHLHTTCLIVYVWTLRSWPGGPPSTHLWRIRWWLQWLKSFPPRMSARKFSERSWPSSKRLKFLRCLRVLQRRPTCSCYVVMPSSGTSISSPQFSLQCVQLRLKVTMWLVLNQRSFKRVSGPSDKLIVWQAHQWLSPSRKKSRPARRRHPRRRLLGLPCLTGWAPLHPQRRGRSSRSRPFELAPEGPVHDPSKEARSLASLLLPQPRNVDGSQVGARLADFAPHWRSLLGNCRATGIVEDGVGIAFQQRPQLTRLLYAFPPFKMVPQVLQKIAQSKGVQVILIAQLLPAASWFPELMDLAQEDPILLFVEGQDLLTQDVCMGGGVTETRHFRPSNLHAWKLSGPFWEQRVIPGKLPTWCQDAYENLHSKCMNLIGQDSWRSVGRKDGMFFESEVIISVPIWCTSSGTDYYPRRLFHIARLWLLCYVIGCTIRHPTRTSSYWSRLSGWNVRCNAKSCPSGIFIWFYCH